MLTEIPYMQNSRMSVYACVNGFMCVLGVCVQEHMEACINMCNYSYVGV